MRQHIWAGACTAYLMLAALKTSTSTPDRSTAARSSKSVDCADERVISDADKCDS